MRSLTSWQELHDEVEVQLVLEAVEHLDDPQAVGLHQDVSLRSDVAHLTSDRVTRGHKRSPATG